MPAGSRVEPALHLVRPGPATGAGVLARCDRASAGPAADRGVAALGQRVLGEQLHGLVVVDVVVGPTTGGVILAFATADPEVPIGGEEANVTIRTWGDPASRLNGLLPLDVRVRRVGLAPDGFDARFSALTRTYRYRVADGPEAVADVRARYAETIHVLHEVAERLVSLAGNDTDFVYRVQALLATEGTSPWASRLDSLADQELELACSSCGFVAFSPLMS